MNVRIFCIYIEQLLPIALKQAASDNITVHIRIASVKTFSYVLCKTQKLSALL